MSDEKQDPEIETAVDHALQRWLGEGEEVVQEHPETDDLVAYQEGQLIPARADEIRRHLVSCSECAQEVLQLTAFDLESSDNAPFLPTSEETDRDWLSFQQQLARTEASATTFAEAEEPQARPAVRSSAPANRNTVWLIAAAITAALIGFGLWRSTSSWLAPKTDQVQVANLHPFFLDLGADDDLQLRDASPIQLFDVPAEMDSLLLRLNLGDQTPHADYRAEIFADRDDTSMWSRSGLRRQPTGQFVIPLQRLASGRYRLRLYGVDTDEEALLGTFTFELRDQAVGAGDDPYR